MVRALKRILRPFRPWLGPIHRRWVIAMDALAPDLETDLERLELPDWPIRAIRRPAFRAMAAADPYYQGRWRYTSRALLEAARLIHRDRLTSALELGARGPSVIVGAHVMDIRTSKGQQGGGPRTTHDARVIPWPFPDKRFDLFIGLQVFEHLGDAQPEAFREVRRVSRHAILSLPIDWDMDDPANAHHRISHERALSWFAPVVPTRVLQGNGGSRRRVIYVFEDLSS